MQTTETIRVSEVQEVQLLRLAYSQVTNPQDRNGPIDAIVNWELASIYVKAVQLERNFSAAEVRCLYIGRNQSHLTAPAKS